MRAAASAERDPRVDAPDRLPHEQPVPTGVLGGGGELADLVGVGPGDDESELHSVRRCGHARHLSGPRPVLNPAPAPRACARPLGWSKRRDDDADLGDPGRGVFVDPPSHRRLVADQRDRVDEVVGDPRRQLLRMWARAVRTRPGRRTRPRRTSRRTQAPAGTRRSHAKAIAAPRRSDRSPPPTTPPSSACSAARRAAVAAVTMLSTMRSALAATAAASRPERGNRQRGAGERLAEPEPVDPAAVDQGPHVAGALLQHRCGARPTRGRATWRRRRSTCRARRAFAAR